MTKASETYRNISEPQRCKCGGTFQAVEGAGDEDDLALVHSMPPCDEFNRYECDEFLAWFRTGDPDAPLPAKGP